MAKIIDTDNFGGDYPNEKFLHCGGYPLIFGEVKAKLVADALNSGMGEHPSRYWRVVPDDYQLQPGFEA